MDYQGRQRLVNYYGIVENVNFILFGQVNVGDDESVQIVLLCSRKRESSLLFSLRFEDIFIQVI